MGRDRLRAKYILSSRRGGDDLSNGLPWPQFRVLGAQLSCVRFVPHLTIPDRKVYIEAEHRGTQAFAFRRGLILFAVVFLELPLGISAPSSASDASSHSDRLRKSMIHEVGETLWSGIATRPGRINRKAPLVLRLAGDRDPARVAATETASAPTPAVMK